jgi:hypothetical protein
MPETLLNIALVIAVLILIGVYVSWRATRLDRLHVRLETARAGLDAALARQLDPATSLLLAAAAHEARIADTDNREFAESDLSRALRAVVDQPDFRATLAGREDGPALLDDLDAAVRKVGYARSFYNNAVTATRAARRKLLPRLLPLSGRAPLPEFFEIDDAPPET